MAIAPWDVLNGGRFRSDAEEEHRRQTGEKGRAILTPDWERTEDEKKMCAALEKVAKEVGTQHLTASKLGVQLLLL
jgi:aryl-alcohol dehydrogenase-like predicted oxidoreductase